MEQPMKALISCLTLHPPYAEGRAVGFCQHLGRTSDDGVEALEKIPKEILALELEKNELTECATLNDLMLAKGQVTRKKSFSLVKRTFSTASLAGTLSLNIWPLFKDRNILF